jgi:hypothetical protein
VVLHAGDIRQRLFRRKFFQLLVELVIVDRGNYGLPCYGFTRRLAPLMAVRSGQHLWAMHLYRGVVRNDT